MPRFFLQIYDSTFIPDHSGTELPSLNEAYVQAITMAGELLRQAGMNLLASRPWRMEVTDEQGQLLLTLHFSAEIARQPPADRSRRQRRPAGAATGDLERPAVPG